MGSVFPELRIKLERKYKLINTVSDGFKQKEISTTKNEA